MEHILEKDKIWLVARNILRNSLDEDIYNRWISSITAVEFNNSDEFILGVPDEFYADWLEEHYSSFINDALNEAACKTITFRFETGHNKHNKLETEAKRESDKKDLTILNCNPKFNFGSFVVGDGNNFAYSAAKAVAQLPGISFNPLFIYGGTGLGKTHLIQASAHEAIQNHNSMKIEYLTCEEFFNFYIDALQNNSLSVFRKRFRNLDMLLIDDVQFLANKTKMQEEFFNNFNALYNENKQIVLTSDRPPSEIDGLEKRLVSRFDNGLTTDVQPPGLETRMAILLAI